MNSSDYGIIFFILVIIVAIVCAWFRHKLTKNRLGNPDDIPNRYHYRAKRAIMTPKEEFTFRRLVETFERKFYVIPQVHLATLLDFEITGQNWYGAFQHINRKSVDYVLLNKETLRPVCAVELDDYTHERKDRQKRDIEVERIFKEANIPLVRLKSVKDLSNREIVQIFANIINNC